MLKDFRLLFTLHLRMQFSVSLLRDSWKRGGKEKRKIVGMGLLFLYAGIMLIGLYCLLLWGLFTASGALGLAQVVMGGVVLLAMLVALIFGTISLLGLVMNATDAAYYAVMPLRAGAVFASKFSMVYLAELGFSALLVLPAVAIYAATCGGSVWLFIRTLLLLPLLPMIPLALSSVVALPLTRLTSLFRHRERFLMIGGILMVGLAVFGQAFLSRTITESILAPEAMFENMDGLLRAATAAFPPAGWLARGLLAAGTQPWLDGALYVLLSAALMLLAVALAGRLYLRGVLAGLEIVRKPVRAGTIRRRPLIGALMLREWHTLIRSSVYALNALSGVVIFPLMILILPLMGGQGGSMSELLSEFTLADRDMLFLLTALLAFMGVLNPAATTTISREGKAFAYLRSMPVSMAAQMTARFALAMCIAMGGIALAAAALLFLGIAPPHVVICAFILAAAASTGATALSMIPDVRNPKLIWNTEAEAMKQNMNSMLGMLLALAALLGLTAAAVLLWLTPLGLWLVFPLLTALFLVFGFFMLRVLIAQAQKSVAKYE